MMGALVAELRLTRADGERTRLGRLLASLSAFFLPQRGADPALFTAPRSRLYRGFVKAAARRARSARRLRAEYQRSAKRALLLEAEALYRRALLREPAQSTPRPTLAELDASCARLAREVELRSPGRLRWLSIFRITVALAVSGASLWLVNWWLFPPHNLALHATVHSSKAVYDTKAEFVVDGYRYGQLGFHSDAEEHPFLTVDLGHETELRRVRVFGRADCCYEQSLPLALELSKDGESFQQILVRKKAFSNYEPWNVSLPPGTTARYVRLRREEKGVLVVSELEVYGP
ncbi:MAG TPA: discoidin domain-containing protein [Polyangiaceae bacterium]|nr:discoidin domain-containing protein [Polyangiaceae bacterium]